MARGTKPGSKFSEETRRHMSESRKGHVVTEETRKKISEAHKGRSMPEEVRQKVSQTKMGHSVSEETREKLSVIHKGKTISEEHRQRISEATKKRHAKKVIETQLAQITTSETDVQDEVPNEEMRQQIVFSWKEQQEENRRRLTSGALSTHLLRNTNPDAESH